MPNASLPQRVSHAAFPLSSLSQFSRWMKLCVVRNILLFLGFTVAFLNVSAVEFNRSSSFNSVEDFVAAAKAFQPATTKSNLSALFTVPQMGQPEDSATGKPVCAPATQSSTALWSGDSFALVFVTAEPTTNATRTVVGILFLLSEERGHWRIKDTLRFSATGKYADVTAELTSDKRPPVIIITESQGGRGSSYRSSATYTLHDSRLERMKLE